MKKFSIELKWSFIFVVMMLLWMWFEKIVGLHSTHLDKHYIYTNFVAVLAILIFVFALLDKRKKFYGGYMTYMQGFMCGVIMTVLITIATPITQYITSEIISPEYFANIIIYSVETGKFTQEAAKEYFNLNNYIIQATIGAFAMGLVTSAIVAIFTMKKAKVA